MKRHLAETIYDYLPWIFKYSTDWKIRIFASLLFNCLQERRIKVRLQMFHKIVNNKIEISQENILIKSKSKTQSTHNQTFRQNTIYP